MNQPMPVNPPALRSHLVEASKMSWQPTQFAGIEMKILYSDDEGRSTILFKMAPGAVVPLHEHTALEQTYMLEGSLEDAEGACRVGDFVWRPKGNRHVARSPNGLSEFRDERWVELYNKKIDEMVAVLKSKGVPVLWVGLPAVRGQKSTSDMLFLDALYREGAAKGGITYVDVWDGFVDEAGQFLQKGPDFEGQTRQLRTYDGVFFTKAGARKLAYYVDREITRLLARSAPIALPSEPATPDAGAAPGQPAPRPLAAIAAIHRLSFTASMIARSFSSAPSGIAVPVAKPLRAPGFRVPAESRPSPPKSQTLPAASVKLAAPQRPPGRFVVAPVP